MKCPECGINHRKYDIAYCCNSKLENIYAFFVILCSGMPGGTCEENLLSYGHDFVYYRKIVKRKLKMKEYMKKFIGEI